MSTRKKRSEAERAIIFAGVMGGLSNARVNELLSQVKARPLPQTSYNWIVRSYVPFFLGRMERLGAAIEHPPTAAQIKEELLPIQDDEDGDL